MARVKETTAEKPAWLAHAEAHRAEKRPVKWGGYLSDDGRKRLQTASLVLGLDQSAIVDALLCGCLVGFYSGWRNGPDKEAAPVGQTEAA